jgi:trimeric autotransporter adhesin
MPMLRWLLQLFAPFKGRGASSRKPVVEEIEPRILYSADVNPLLWAGQDPNPTAIVAAVDTGSNGAAVQTVDAQQQRRHEIVFVDAALPDAQKLIDGLLSQRGAQVDLEVVQLRADADGLRQISDMLAGEQNIDAIHIISHGDAGRLQLGNATIEAATLQARSAELQSWRTALTDNADVLLYGCDVARGAVGQAFVGELAQLTGSDVAASVDPTGQSQLGGNWNLEYRSGQIESAMAVGAADQQAWAGLLAITTNSMSASSTTAATTTLTWSHTVNAGSNRVLIVGLSIDNGSTATGVTYGGQAMTLVGRTVSAGNGTIELWSLVAPTVGTANIVASIGTAEKVVGGAASFDGVDQATPTSGGVTGTAGTGSAASHAIASASGDLAIGVLWGNDGVAATEGGGQTTKWSFVTGAGSGNPRGVGSTEAGAASVTMSWTLGASVQWVVGGTSIKAAAVGNVAPTITNLSGDTMAYSAGNAATVIEQGANATVADADSANFDTGALTVSFAAGGVSAQDVLSIRNQGSGAGQIGVSGSNVTYAGTTIGTWAGGSGGSDLVISLNANANATNTAALIQNIAYQNTDATTPTTGARTVRFVLADGDGGISSNYDTTVNVSLRTAAVVTTTADTVDGNTSSIAALNANKGADGLISLREAIIAANNSAGADTIHFGIAGTGVHTITLSSILPSITGQVTIDATTDDSFAANGNRPAIVLDGGNAITDGLQLYTGSDGSTVRGLVIQRFTEDGIDIASSSGNIIAGNWVGLTSAGTAAAGNFNGINIFGGNNNVIGGLAAADRNVISGNAGPGVWIGGGSTGNQISGNYIGTNVAGTGAVANAAAGIDVYSGGNVIGGAAAGAGNVISGNAVYGVSFTGAAASGNTVAGNFIGLAATGTAMLGNGNDGVFIIDGASGNTIGGATAAYRNVIAGNSDGVQIGGLSGGANSNVVQNNYIGTDVTGTLDFGNNDDGVDIDNAALNNQVLGNLISGNTSDGIDLGDAGASTGTVIRGNLIGTAANGGSALGNSGRGIFIGNGGTANNTLIGGAIAGQGNTVAFNALGGIYVPASTSVAMLGNMVFSNVGLGIDLGTAGITANDAGDADSGANGLQNFPVLASANSNGAGTTIAGSLNSNANTTFRIEFFANRPTVADATNGEGERYLGFITVTTDGAGNANVNTTLANTWVNSGDRITATATVDLGGGAYGSTSEFAANVTATSTGIIVVDTTSDAADGTTTSIANLGNARGADGRISLREAIIAANNTANGGTPDKIVFAIPVTDANHVYYQNNGVVGAFSAPVATTLTDAAIADFDADYAAGTARSWYRITLGVNELEVTQSVIIDGSTQTGYDAAKGPIIEIDAAAVTSGDGNGLTLTTGATTVRGLVINNSFDNAIEADVGAGGTVIVGNYLGTDVSGTQARGNTTGGAYGAIAIKSNSVVVGGTTMADRNLISGNAGYGVEIYTSASGAVVQGNTIGTSVTGAGALGNAVGGVYIHQGAANNTIGGTGLNQGNLIADNGGDGIWLDATAASGNALLGNTIYSNSGQAIDLGANGITANDAGDGDSGPNGLQNFPVLASANSNSAGTTIAGTLNSTSGATYRIEFYANRPTVADAANGEGERFLGFINVTTDGAGNASVNTTLANVWVNSGDRITATATNLATNNTSEFAANVTATSTGIVVVDTVSDVADGTTTSITNLGNARGADGRISLREAIIATNATANGGTPDKIVFNIDGSGPHLINVASALPAISQALIIDGSTEPDYASNGNRPVVVLDGNNLAADGLVLSSSADGSTIRGLVIRDFGGSGITVQAGSDSNTIAGNYLGALDTAGNFLAGEGNGPAGIYMFGANNTIGGTAAGAGNVISGNAIDGIFISGSVATGNVVQGNRIGTDAAGTTALGNARDGVVVYNGAANNTIGGAAAGAGNLISGNAVNGVQIDGNGNSATANNVVQGNLIGTNAAGTAVLANGNSGVVLLGMANNTLIGGTAAGAGNVVSGNVWFGIEIVGAGSDFNTVQGNLVGTDRTGLLALGNGNGGVSLYNGASNNLIGGTAAGARNVISASGTYGVYIATLNPTANRVQGNYIGTDISGSGLLGNGGSGVQLENTASGNLIGGVNAGEGNVIAGNGRGVYVFAGAGAGNAVLGNSIHSNTQLGIDLGSGGVTANDSGDGDGGANNLQNFPVIAGAFSSGGSTTISGSINSNASTTLRIEFFSSPAADASGYGEGRTYLGFVTVTTDAGGNAPINAVLGGVSVTAGQAVSATATVDLGGGNYGSTSEFAASVVCQTPPTNTVPGAKTVNEDTALVINGVSVSDPDGNLSTVRLTVANGTLSVNLAGGATISLGANASASLTLSGTQAQINAALAAITYQGTSNFNGSDTLTMLSTDSFGAIDGDTVAITVNAVNDAPVITSDGGAATASVNVAENSSAVTTVTSTDVDGGTAVYSIAGGVDAARFTINASTGALSFVVAPNYEAPADAGANNVYDVTVQVSDGAGGTDTQAVAVTVTPVNDNAPVITSNGGGAAAAVSVAENTTAVTIVMATDADLPAQTLTYSISGGADAALFSIDSVTGVLSFNSAPNFEAPADAGGNNVYDVAVQVSDGNGGTDTQNIAVTVTNLNEAPVLSGANSLAAIAEDAVANSGTLVSSLISARVTDQDAGAQSGIAVVAVDNTNGSWQYSLDGGSNWSAFGAPSGSAARLLAADALTRVRFVPNADWNGTVVNGITFHAWDQSAGTAGSTATVAGSTVLDAFSTASYANNNGSANWTGNWVETDNNGGGAGGGLIRVTSGALQVQSDNGNDNIYRQADLSGQTSATLSFSYQNTIGAGQGDAIRLQVSGNGGGSYTTLATFNAATNTGAGSLSFDISNFIAGNTRIRMIVTSVDVTVPVYFDNLQIAFGNSTGGQTAFSNASAASAITVTPVNDAPVITSNAGGPTASVSVAENSSAVTTVNSADIDGGAPLYSISGGADAARFTINASTGALAFVTAPDFEAPTDAGGNNVYDVTVQVADGNGGTDTQAIAVTVTDVSSALVVTTAADNNDTGLGSAFNAEQLNASKGSDGAISLREALIAANNTSNPYDVVSFNIAGAGMHTITVGATALPTITGAVLIDGWSQGGFSGAPLIELSGGYAGSSVDGLTLGTGSDGSTVRGLIINRFTGNGIEINGSSYNTLQGNWIGLDATGAAAAANVENGLYATSSIGNLIGGTTATERNVISGNGYRGIYFVNVDSSTLRGNYIGTDVSGSADVNGSSSNLNQSGVVLASGSDDNIVGGTTAAARNVISGNNHFGVEFQFGSQNNRLEGNFVGTTVTGMAVLGNLNGGVSYWNAGSGNVTGGGAAGAGNVISGNGSMGVLVANASSGAVIQGNTIGLGWDGDTVLANGQSGIDVTGGSTNTLIGTDSNGTNDAGERNVISGNLNNGVAIEAAGTTGTVVAGNTIGTSASGTVARGNGWNGVAISGGATNNTIGGTAAGAGNLLSGNVDSGIAIVDSGTSGNVVLGNVIGLNATQTAVIGNVGQGMWIGVGASGNSVGGTAPGAANIVGGNGYAGIVMWGVGTNGNSVVGNIIGTDATGTTSFGNGHGVAVVAGASGTLVGGTAAGAGNLIANNSGAGVFVDAVSSGNALLGNSIRGNGGLGIDLGNDGVTANDASDADSGANDRQNFPVLMSANGSGGNTTIVGVLDSSASTTYRIEFFSSPTADASGYGEGQTYLGFATVTTDASGHATINATLVGISVTAGDVVSATATVDLGASYGDTSEFSATVVCQGPPVNTVPGAQSVNEDTALVINGVSVTDLEGNLSSVSLGVGNGTLSVSLAGGATISAGANASASLTLSGTQAQINAALSAITYQAALNYNGADTLSVLATDTLGATDSDSLTITVNAVNDAPTAADRALQFDGNDVVVVPASPGLQMSATVTIEVNVQRTNALPATGMVIVNKEGEYEVGISATGGLRYAFASTTPGWNWVDTGYTLPPDQWAHVAVSYDNGNVAVYVDGVLVHQAAGSGTIGDAYPAYNDLTFGGRSNASDQRFIGLIDDVRIWNTARSGAQIQANYASSLTGAEAGLAGYWRFDEVAGATAIDSTAQGNHGVLGNGLAAETPTRLIGYTLAEDGVLNVGAPGVLLFASDPDGDPLTATLVSGPANAASFTLNADGSFTYVPLADFNGVDSFTFSASDGSLASAPATIYLRVTPVADAPVITSNGAGPSASITVAENTTAVTTVSATDADLPAQTLSYSIVGGADAARFTIDSVTGALSFAVAPNYEAPADAGADNVYDVTVQVADGNGGFDTQAIAVTVTDVNEAPTITSDGGGASATVNVVENQTAVTTVTSTDVDGAAPSYSIVGGADAARFTIDGVTGALTFVVAPNYEAPTDAGADNTYDVTVQVADGNGGFDTQTIAVAVTNVNEAPVITNNGGGASANINAAENQTAVTTLTSSDVDGGAPSYSIVGGADAALFTIDSVTGAVSFATAPDFESPTDAGGNGIYNLTVQVADGNGGFDTQVLVVRVTNVAEAPVITSHGGGASAAINADENQTAVGTVTATDSDGDTPAYSIVGGADAALFSIDSASGVLTFNIAPNFEAPADADGDNVYLLTVQVADGNGGFDTQAISVTVRNVNEAPAITSLGGGASAGVTIAENQTAVAVVTSADVDGGAAQYSIVGGADASRFTIDAAAGILSFTAAPDFEAPADANRDNVYDLVINVADGNGGVDTQTIAVAVSGVNEAPGNIRPASVSLAESAPAGTVVAIVTASDPDAGDLFTFTLVNDGAGRFVVDPASGRLQVAPGAVLDFESAPSHTLVVRVTDAQGLRTDQTIVVTLSDVAESPADMWLPDGVPPPAPAPNAAPPAGADVPAITPVGTTPTIESVRGNGREATAARPLLPGTAGADAALGAQGSDLRLRPPQHGRTLVDGAPLLVASVSFSFDGVGAGGWSSDVLDGLQQQQMGDTLAPRFGLFSLRGSSIETDANDDNLRAAGRTAEQAVLTTLQDPVRVASATLTAGFVWWLTRSGGLLTSILMGIPAWRHVDLLPVLAPARDDDDDDAGLDNDLPEADAKATQRDSLVDDLFSNTSRQFGESRYIG